LPPRGEHQPGTWIYNANNELQSYGTGVQRRVLSYDANGSTVREELGDPSFQVTDYVYDPERSEASAASDRLIEVKRDGVTQVEYAYDPYGQRIWRETKPVSLEGATITWFLYSTEGLIGEYRADGSLIREYGWLPNGLWGTDPVWQHDATGTHVMHNDHLFTPERMTRTGESVVSWAGNREAFGRVAVQPGSSTTMLLRFPGQWEDGVGGFYQNWWREYGAGVGRYRSVDPLSLLDGVNFFLYSNGRPLGSFDGTGLLHVTLGLSCKEQLSPLDFLLFENDVRSATLNARKSPSCRGQGMLSIVVYCDYCDGACGYVNTSRRNEVCIDLQTSLRCGRRKPGTAFCREATIMHEMIHSCGQDGEEEPLACEKRFYSGKCDIKQLWEIPRLCRGDRRSLTFSEVKKIGSMEKRCSRAEGFFVHDKCIDEKSCENLNSRLRKGPFEGPAIVKPPALPGDTYSP
jgi:RHS repeat-associated protein